MIEPKTTNFEKNKEKQNVDVTFEEEKPLLRETRSPHDHHHEDGHHGMNFLDKFLDAWRSQEHL